MKKLLLSSVSALALFAGSSAYAADLPRKAPVYIPPAPPVLSWTGCYVGAQVGWGWGRKNVHHTYAFSFSGGAITNASKSFDTSGAVFGGQVGCDYQFASNWVIGAQGMFLGTDINGSGREPSFIPPNTNDDVHSVKQTWLGTVTGRLGYTWTPDWLAYIKGGGAWTREQWYYSTRAGTAEDLLQYQSRTGWTVGGGLEYAFARNWSGFAEFNYYDFGTKDLFNATFGFGAFEHIGIKQQVETVTVGLNYRFR